MEYRVVNLWEGTEEGPFDNHGLWDWAEQHATWALTPLPADAQALADRISAHQNYDVEAEPEGPAPQEQERPPEGARAIFRAGELLSDPDAIREHRVSLDGEGSSAAACAAAGLDPDDLDARRQARQIAKLIVGVRPLKKGESAHIPETSAGVAEDRNDPEIDHDAVVQTTMTAPEAAPVAEAVRKAIQHGHISPIALSGKHARGTMLARTHLGPILLKPGS